MTKTSLLQNIKILVICYSYSEQYGILMLISFKMLLWLFTFPWRSFSYEGTQLLLHTELKFAKPHDLPGELERCVEAISPVARVRHVMWSRLTCVIACTRGSVMRAVSFSALFLGEPEESRSTARQDTKVARVTRDSISYRFNRVQQIEVNEYKFRYDSQN